MITSCSFFSLKELFEKAQAKLEHNRKRYRNPRVPQMLSSLVRCGCCEGSVFANRRYYVDKRMNPPKAYNRLSYQCNYKFSKYVHAEKNRPKMRPCDNISIKGEVLEEKVFGMIEGNMFNEKKMKASMSYFKQRAQASELKFEKQIKKNGDEAKKTEESKKRLIDLYTSSTIERDEYVDKSLELDNKINKLRLDKQELLKKIPLLNKKDVVTVAVRKFCTSARAKYTSSKDFDSKRQFLLNYTNKINYYNTKVEYHGFIPVETEVGDQIETAKLEFIFTDTISYADRIKRPKGPISGSVQIGRKDYDSLTEELS